MESYIQDKWTCWKHFAKVPPGGSEVEYYLSLGYGGDVIGGGY